MILEREVASGIVLGGVFHISGCSIVEVAIKPANNFVGYYD